MNVRLLIDAIVRQTTVLIAQLATSGGVRAPLSHIANQVFLELARELDAQGISRKVSADMFGMALRTYQRKTQRLAESATDRGRSLWEAVYDYLGAHPVVTRAQVLKRFHYDEQAQVRSVLHDLTESGLVFSSGSGPATAFRLASDEELDRLRQAWSDPEVDALVWAMLYRDGPLHRDALMQDGSLRAAQLDAALTRLVQNSRATVEETDDGPVYDSAELVIGLEESVGWEAAVFDHFQAMVKTIAGKLQLDPMARRGDVVGGST